MNLQVSTTNLERVRRIKNRLVRLTTRVQTLREMLEKLMDDDSDMHAMHLTARAYDQLERQAEILTQYLLTREVACLCSDLAALLTLCIPGHARLPALWELRLC